MIHKGIQINETTKNNTHKTHTQAISSHQSVSNKNVYYRKETVGSGVEPDTCNFKIISRSPFTGFVL